MELEPAAIERLLARAPELGALRAYAVPRKLRGRSPGFASLVRLVAEQAVSQAAAQAVWARLEAAAPPVDPAALQRLGPEGLVACGLSRSKANCVIGLAGAVDAGALDLPALARADDAEVRAKLMAQKGIGRWTADLYLLLALRRPDVWPAHDLALREAVRDVLGHDVRPSVKEVDVLGERFRPDRSTATVLLWEHYLARSRTIAIP